MALITAAQVREHYATLTGTNEDTILNTLITRADSDIAQFCGWVPDNGIPTMEDQTYTIYIDGPSDLEPRALYLDVPPIVSVTSASTDSTGGEQFATSISGSDYVIDNKRPRRLIMKDTSSSVWLTGLRKNKIVAVCGFTSTPPDLVSACAMQVNHLLNLRHSQGLQTINAGGQSATKAFNPEQGGADFRVPPLVQAALRPYRLVGSYVA